VLHIDDGVLDAVLKLARPNVRVDRKPSQARHLRMHGTDRRDDASGRFTGAGVYRLIGGYDKRGVPLARDYEPTVASDGACWHSVRAGERLVRRLLLDPHNAYPRAVTEAARQLLQVDTPANTVSWACVLAAAGGDEAREVKLLLSASDGSWFVVSSQLPCDDCGERTEQRCLARLAAFEDGAGDQWLSVYRWTLCLGGCCTDRPVQSLAAAHNCAERCEGVEGGELPASPLCARRQFVRLARQFVESADRGRLSGRPRRRRRADGPVPTGRAASVAAGCADGDDCDDADAPADRVPARRERSGTGRRRRVAPEAERRRLHG
jgi:hypothetical protein